MRELYYRAGIPEYWLIDARGADIHPLLTLVERTIVQDQGSWQVDYRLRYEGGSGMIVTPNEVLAKVEGWVSNSRPLSLPPTTVEQMMGKRIARSYWTNCCLG